MEYTTGMVTVEQDDEIVSELTTLLKSKEENKELKDGELRRITMAMSRMQTRKNLASTVAVMNELLTGYHVSVDNLKEEIHNAVVAGHKDKQDIAQITEYGDNVIAAIIMPAFGSPKPGWPSVPMKVEGINSRERQMKQIDIPNLPAELDVNKFIKNIFGGITNSKRTNRSIGGTEVDYSLEKISRVTGKKILSMSAQKAN